MAEYPEWKQAACKWCREGRRIVMELHHDSADGKWLLGCTAPTEAQHIKNLTAELDTANEVIRRIAQMFGVTDTRHILGDLGRVQAGIGVMRTALRSTCDELGKHACKDRDCGSMRCIAYRGIISKAESAMVERPELFAEGK